jgi:histone deacetylase 1/2
MSLSATTSDDSRVRVILRTADQYHLWRARVNGYCWAATRINIFTITDDECNDLLSHELKNEQADTIGRCWTLICNSLHDELFLKLVHVKHGHIQTLMAEIRSALLVNIVEDIQPLRLELYAASMQRDCNNDLQSYIAYIIQRRDKLLFLKVEVPDSEVAHIFLKGLPAIFQPLQVHFAIPGNKPQSFAALVDVVRKFASSPIVSAELAKLKSTGVTQNIFASVSRPSGVNSPKDKPFCHKFSKFGSCSYGDKCRFYHSTRTNGPKVPVDGRPSHAHLQECSYCHFKGHTVDVCRKKARNNNNNNTNQPISLTVTTEEKAPDNSLPIGVPLDQEDTYGGLTGGADPFCFMLYQGQNVEPTTRPGGWVLDSGATCCATFNAADCIDIVPCKIQVTAAGCTFDVTQKGTAIISACDKQGKVHTLRIRDCLISKRFPFKLLSLQTFVNKGYSILMDAGVISLSNRSNNAVLLAEHDAPSGLYFLVEKRSANCVTSRDAYCDLPVVLLAKSYPATVGGDLLWTLHLRHGHKNFTDVCRQYGLPIPKTIPACSSCVMGKSHLHPYLSSGFTRATRPAEGFHTDFRGPFSCPTPSGQLYLLTIIDDYSRRIFAFLVKSQMEWFDIWSKFVTRVEAEFGKPNQISWLLSDNGGVYKSQIMTNYCASKGIQQRHSAPYSQFMDHTAERNMRTLGEMMTTTMLHANFPKRAWGFAALHAAEVINRTAESSASNKAAGVTKNFSRLERWRGMAVPGQTKGLYPFGCLAFKHVPSAMRTKLDAHATPVVYLGLDAASRAFLLGSIYDLSTSVSVEVTFFENIFPFRKLKQSETPSSLLWGPDPLTQSIDPRLGLFETAASDASSITKLLERNAVRSDDIPYDEPVKLITPITPEAPVATQAENSSEEVVENEPTVLRRSTRVKVPRVQTNQKYREPVVKPNANLVTAVPDQVGSTNNLRSTALNMVTEATLETITPRSAHDAMKSAQKDSWLAAMNREKDCHTKNKTFDTSAVIPDGAKTIPADWVFKIKHRGGPINVNDLTEKQFKARVVIRGQYMKQGLNYNDTFAPVAKPATLRALLAIATKYGCLLNSGDIETAFLSAKMDCEVWVKMPPYWGNESEAITDTNVAVPSRLLLKGVPGIPQGSRLFYETFAARLLAMGYKPSPADKCLFINDSLSERNAILIWVDDFIAMHEKDETFVRFIALLRKDFNVPLVGPLLSFLGMTIKRNLQAKTMAISQKNSILVLLERSNMMDSNSVSTPCVTGAIFSKNDSPTPPGDNDSINEYRSLVALANFISCWTRPDITFVVNKLCKFMSNPGPLHWKYLKHLLRYLGGTRDTGLFYDFGRSNLKQLGLHGYTDSSFADCPDTGRSTLAYTFLYHDAILSWYSKLNSYVTTCTNHSEYNALALGAKESEWLLLLFTQLDSGVSHSPVPIFVDNSGVVSMVYNPVDHQSNKHVKVGCHYTRELVTNRIIIPQRVNSETNLADIFTKPLGVSLFKQLVSAITSPSTSYSLLMMSHRVLPATQPNDGDSDSENESANPSTEFRRNWPFASVLKQYLKAVTYEVKDLGEIFSTGRKKYEVSFYGSNISSGVRYLISKHDGMQLASKKGGTYLVCKITPRDETNEAEPREAPAIELTMPQPILSCAQCGIVSTVKLPHISCTSCCGTLFVWSCNCVQVKRQENKEPTPQALPTTEQPATLAETRNRDRKIKYEPPIARGAVYHHISCTKLTNTIRASIDFAKAYDMKRADCCSSMFSSAA